MPPLWIEHSVWLASKKLILASQPRLQKADKQWTSATIDAQSAALALQQRLETRPKSSISTLNILLSGDWVRYAVLPWQDGLYQPDDWNAYARLILAQQFAGSAEGWRLCINPAGFGEPRLVAAMDESVYQVIIELTRTNKLRLSKVQPLFSAVHHLYRKQLKAPEFALVISEADQLCCGFWRDGAWQGVISLPQNQDSEALLNGGMAALLRQAAMLAQVSLPPQIYISSSTHPLAKLSLPECEVSYLGAVHPLFAGDWAL